MKKIKVEILYWEDCPSWNLAIERVKAATEEIEKELKQKIFEISTREVKTDEEAQKISFRGSPTILVNGKDIDESGQEINPVGLTCRVYFIDGKYLPLPPYEYIYRRIKELALEEIGNA